jgi:hypothetical protein
MGTTAEIDKIQAFPGSGWQSRPDARVMQFDIEARTDVDDEGSFCPCVLDLAGAETNQAGSSSATQCHRYSLPAPTLCSTIL